MKTTTLAAAMSLLMIGCDISKDGSSSHHPMTCTEKWDRYGPPITFNYAQRNPVTGTDVTYIFYLDSDDKIIAVACAPPGETDLSWANKNVTVHFFKIEFVEYRPRGDGIVAVMGEAPVAVYNQRGERFDVRPTQKPVYRDEVADSKVKDQEKLGELTGGIITDIVMPKEYYHNIGYARDMARRAGIPVGLRLYGRANNIVWYGPEINEFWLFRSFDALLFGTGVNRDKIAVNVEGAWKIGSVVDVYDASGAVTGHKLRGELAELTKNQQAKIETRLVNLQVLSPVGRTKAQAATRPLCDAVPAVLKK